MSTCNGVLERPLYSALDEEKMPKEVISILTAAGTSRTKSVSKYGTPVHKVKGVGPLQIPVKWNYGVVFYHNLISLGSDAPNPPSAKRKADADGGGAAKKAKRGPTQSFLARARAPPRPSLCPLVSVSHHPTTSTALAFVL